MAKGKPRKNIKTQIAYDLKTILDGKTLDEAIAVLESYRNSSYDEIKLMVEYDYDYSSLDVWGIRKENDKEYEKRCGIEDKQKKERIKRAKIKLLNAQKELKKLELGR